MNKKKKKKSLKKDFKEYCESPKNGFIKKKKNSFKYISFIKPNKKKKKKFKLTFKKNDENKYDM
jgi:hypothetical protein